MSFLETFVFSRPAAAPYRGPGGGRVIAPANTPRFDHDASGAALGVLVEPGAEPGQADRVRLAGPAMAAGAATVFHARRSADGVILRRAHYTLDASATIDACLTQVGHHCSIGAVAGFVAIRRGIIAYRGQRWAPPAVVTLPDGTTIGVDQARALLAG
jgi:hypothetical protein